MYNGFKVTIVIFTNLEGKRMKLEVKNIKKTFGETEVLHGISFSISSGKALGLLGRNGAGKTTTIRILMDVFKANEGEIIIDGKKFNPKDFQIGYLPEERGLYPKKKVIDQLMYLGNLRGISLKEAKTNGKFWLKRLGIEEYENRLLETLSKGNQQKVQLAQTLVCNPEIVILDEPFSGLDPVNAQILKDVVTDLIQDGKLVIFSSHHNINDIRLINRLVQPVKGIIFKFHRIRIIAEAIGCYIFRLGTIRLHDSRLILIVPI